MAEARIYLDWNATAPLRPAARAAMLAALDLSGNPSSVHGEGRAARAAIDAARRSVAALVAADPARVVFTSGASEAASHVLTPDFSVVRSPLAISHCFVGATEHACILDGGRFAPQDVSRIPVDGEGLVDRAALEHRLAARDPADGVAMVALQLVNSETGVVQPIRAVADIVHAHDGLLVVDAVQAVGRLVVSIGDLGADFLILSSHKIGGPKGAGALVSAGETTMPAPLVRGGGQEKGHRSGTENCAAIAGFGAAAAEVAVEAPGFAAAVGPLRDRLEAGIREIAADVVIYGGGAPRVANTSFFALAGLKAETAQIAFDLDGIAISAGSACSSGKVARSHVLAAMGHDSDQGALRASIGATTTAAEIDCFLAAFATVAKRRHGSVEAAA